jgi:hypothetical protein
MKTNTESLNSLFYEIHMARCGSDPQYDPSASPWNSGKQEPSRKPLSICESDGIVWFTPNAKSQSLKRVRQRSASAIGFSFVRNRGKPALALLSNTDGVLVNGRPALPLSILAVKDCLVLGPAVHAYVTERVRPYVGAPPESLIGKQCPFCRIPFTADTTIASCRCGAAYHYEQPTDETEADPDEILRCFEKVRQCLACGRQLTLEEYLEWDPARL